MAGLQLLEAGYWVCSLEALIISAAPTRVLPMWTFINIYYLGHIIGTWSLLHVAEDKFCLVISVSLCACGVHIIHARAWCSMSLP